MLIDLNVMDPQQKSIISKRFDIVIVGGGVAGIVLALKLSKKYRIVLLEAGGLVPSVESQILYEEEASVGHPYFSLKDSRIRCLGGSSNCWNGYCRPLELFDFIPNPQVKNSGWPITKSDLDPFINDVRDILDIPQRGDLSYLRKNDPFLLKNQNDIESIEFWFSGPTRIGKKYRNFLESSKNVTCVINANVTELVLKSDCKSVEKVGVVNYAGAAFTFVGNVIVLAAGGIENPRILLNSNKLIPAGIGNEYDLVGRYFSEHHHYTIGRLRVEDLVRNWCLRYGQDTKWFLNRYYSPQRSYMLNNKTLNYGLRLHLVSDLMSQDSIQAKFKQWLYELIYSTEAAEKLHSYITGKSVRFKEDGKVRIASEQALNYESRIMLGHSIDRFGKKRIILDWKISDIDKRTLQIAVKTLAAKCIQNKIGRIQIEDWLHVPAQQIQLPGLGEDEVGGNHHMCTTRMALSPKEGVVNSDQRVHSVSNLYIAGSSVFSTGGHANPTFTIVQMTLRLAQHLNQKKLS